MRWVIWAIILLIQNAGFTWLSRARNSGSITYHGIAAIISNGVWFISQIFVVALITEAIKSHNLGLLLITAIFYTFFTVTGSISMHHFLMKYIEVGKRKVGG